MGARPTTRVPVRRPMRSMVTPPKPLLAAITVCTGETKIEP
jgi:hypothetical protein